MQAREDNSLTLELRVRWHQELKAALDNVTANRAAFASVTCELATISEVAAYLEDYRKHVLGPATSSFPAIAPLSYRMEAYPAELTEELIEGVDVDVARYPGFLDLRDEALEMEWGDLRTALLAFLEGAALEEVAAGIEVTRRAQDRADTDTPNEGVSSSSRTPTATA